MVGWWLVGGWWCVIDGWWLMVVVVLVVAVVLGVVKSRGNGGKSLDYSFSGVVESRGTGEKSLGYCRPRKKKLKRAFSGREQTIDHFMVTAEFPLRNQY